MEAYVSDQAFEKALAGGKLINREKHRTIKAFTREQMSRYIATIYRHGYEDGAQDVLQHLEEVKTTTKDAEDPEQETVSVDWEDVLKVIAEVKGIGEKTIQRIDEKLREVF